MEECLYSPGEVIFRQNDEDDSSIYYIAKGSVKILFETKNSNRENTVFKTLLKKQHFGELSFITGFCRANTVQANDFCRIFRI